MKKILSLSAFLAIALFIGAGCQTASTANSTADNGNKSNQPKNDAPKADAPKTGEPTDNAPRITLADAKKEFDAGSAVFVDTRAEAAYKNERIKGAVNLVANAPEEEYKKLPTDKKIIAYCS